MQECPIYLLPIRRFYRLGYDCALTLDAKLVQGGFQPQPGKLRAQSQR
jgi:hypothetical protein